MTNENSERMAGKKIEILLVEDNIGDQRLTIEAFKDSRVIRVPPQRREIR